MSFNDAYRAIRYRVGDPLRYSHVPRRARLDVDPAPETNLEIGNPGEDLAAPDPAFTGEVVPEEKLN